MDTDLPAHPDHEPAALRRYRELVARLSDPSALTDEAFDLLAPPGGDTAGDEGVWVPLIVTSGVVPEV
ncbi:hypothetical protein SAMN04515665_110130 [Blastococcus sp. DSM 46786]|uniref:hypothetical protein n=1 Tax=Geodermatophilaceae TaxID=85030 RepID=UPI0008CFED02|nr:hypothetical protein [Blastococcus sp. DSM 46786]SEL26963.1 hypothetical protein SAMN04515665_110130 [Blastococcus sp. DSM 46786]